MKKNSKKYRIFWLVMFVAAFMIMGYVGYSDGDDAYFYQYTHSMGFWEYLKWRYETWVGRMAGEALVYIAFHLGLTFWRVINALMLVLLPMGLIYLANRAARIPEGTLQAWKYRHSACEGIKHDELGLGIAAAAVMGYFMMSADTLGYAAVWVNGSIFYTWTFTCGIWALTTFADFVFSENPATAGIGEKVHFSMEGSEAKKFLYAIPCAVIATMSIEQMAAVLLVFELLGIIYGICKWRRVHPLLLVQTVVTLVAFIVLMLAPGNEIRVAAEIANWMPQYETMSFGQHLFITVHWLLSSFANENKLFLCVIWAAGILLLLQKRQKNICDWGMLVTATIFTVVSLLPYIGVTNFSDMGMQYLDVKQCIYEVPTVDAFSGMQLLVFVWWILALVYTFVFLWYVSGCQITLLLAYLAGIASEAVLFFSPTMYASGGRVYYLTDILYLFIALCLVLGLRDTRWQKCIYGLCVVFGIVNFVSQVSVFVGMM